VTGERDGYYADYAQCPLQQLGRCLAEGFAYQGDPSQFRGGAPRGEPSACLPAAAFVNFTQTHDQVGNRAFGERLAALAPASAVRVAVACVLLSPAPPMLFMGEEFGAATPFLYFCDFGPELAAAVTRGRREEFGQFERFRESAARAAIPDPTAAATFAASTLDWSAAASPDGRDWRAFYTRCLALRRAHIVPRLRGLQPGGRFEIVRDAVLRVQWTFDDGTKLHLGAHFGVAPIDDIAPAPGTPLYESASGLAAGGTWPAPAVVVCLQEAA
jgi:1,4-alpha-glucan branching enzyme